MHKLILLLVACVCLVGCSSREAVQVIDPSGQPIAGANVVAVSLSMNAGPIATDAQGKAELPANVQGTRWIEVSKNGFETTRVDVPKAWPARITLKPLATK